MPARPKTYRGVLPKPDDLGRWRPVVGQSSHSFDGRTVLPVTSSGKPWYRAHSKNAQSSFGNWWTHLLDRVKEKYPDFPRLPFGKLFGATRELRPMFKPFLETLPG
jgi:hypothetical protein